MRDANFGVTFTHPSVVRAGQEYDLGVTLFNSGSRTLNGVSLQLAQQSVSGATLLDEPTKVLSQSIPTGSSGTIKWRLRANVTGQVTSSYVKVGEGIDAGLKLVTGVGDRNVPLSPDSLILPDPVRHLPPDIVESARQLLGQAWSVANAPAGALPAGVLPVTKQTVINRAVELGYGGLRRDFGEPLDKTLHAINRDWLGELTNDNGFADAMRNTPAGYYFFDTVGTKFYEAIQNGQSPGDFHQTLALQEAARSAFISALVSQQNGVPVAGAKLISPRGEKVGWGINQAERFGDLKQGASFDLLENDPHSQPNPTNGKLLLVSKPVTGNWQLELTGWNTGTADVSILAPTSGRDYRQIRIGGLNFTEGKRFRITFKNSGTTAPIIEEMIGSTYQPVNNAAVTINNLAETNAAVVGVMQVTPDVVGGGDPFGRLVGVLFSKPMDTASVETIARYQIGGGVLVSDPTQQIGKPISVRGAAQNFGKRFVILSLTSPVGPFIERNLSVSGIRDTSGKTVISSSGGINMRVSPEAIPPGAFVTGRVMSADGTPISNAVVSFLTDPQSVEAGTCNHIGGLIPQVVAQQTTGTDGEFEFDYVREGKCLPVMISAINAATNSSKTLIGNIYYHGQHLTLNAVYLARGNVRGTVTSGGNPIPNAYVSVIAESDVVNSKTVRTDIQGNYEVSDIPVGNVTVKVVGTGVYSLSSGIGSGTIEGPGATAVVNVTTQNVSGVISGKVINPDTAQTPLSGALVIASAHIPGFPRADGTATTVGYAFADANGNFTISNLPIGDVYLRALDPQTGNGVNTTVQLTSETPQVENILIVMSGFGSISGRVTDEIGQPIASAVVSAGNSSVLTDASGNYLVPRVSAGTIGISARVSSLGLTGGTTVTVTNGQAVTNADIVIKRPANLQGANIYQHQRKYSAARRCESYSRRYEYRLDQLAGILSTE